MQGRAKPIMLLEAPKSCTQATSLVPVVPFCVARLPSKKRHNEIIDLIGTGSTDTHRSRVERQEEGKRDNKSK